jgi:glyoxylase-like metal-dependent hydrolase (beta-lactamase superfamily II)
LLVLTTGVSTAWSQNDDFSTVEVTAHHVAGSFYYLAGRGGNIGVLAGDDGVVMVDTQFAPLTQKIMNAIAGITDGEVRVVINTHVHGDHTGGNQNLRAMGLPVFAHDNVRVRMAKGMNGGAPAPETAMPAATFADELHMHFNGEDIRVFKVPPAHTDGDVYVYFPVSDVLHMGDVFRTTGYPLFDVGNGGSAQGTIEALDVALALAGPNTKMVPGHGDVSTAADVREMRDMIAEVISRVTPLIDQGMTLEQVVAAAPTADLDERWGSPERFLPGLYQSLAEGAR